MTKHCKYCNQDKPVNAFYPHSKTSDRLDTRCKECFKRLSTERVQQNQITVENKCCASCEEVKPAREFHKDKSRPDGLNPYCKMCKNQRQIEYSHQPEIQEHSRAWHRQHQQKPEVQERKREYNHLPHVFAKMQQTVKRYRENNPEKFRESKRKYYEKTKDKIADYQKEYRSTNPDKIKAGMRKWQKENPDKVLLYQQRRRSKELQVIHAFTLEHWQFALHYFDNHCAVCGKSPGLFRKLAQDHWIPISRGGNSTPDNIVPLCPSCNHSKHAIPPQDWLAKKFGVAEAEKILSRIERYFECSRNQQFQM